MWCTLCRAPIIADPSQGSEAKLQTLAQLSPNDVAHLSSAHGFTYGNKQVAEEYVPMHEELGLLAQGEKNGASLFLYTQQLAPKWSNWLLHTACLDILLHELELTEPNMKTWHLIALFQFRTDTVLYGEFVGMRDADNKVLKYVPSPAQRPMMKRLDWKDGVENAWKFRDPNSNAENRARIIKVAQLMQRIRIAAGNPTPRVTRWVLEYRNKKMTMDKSLPFPSVDPSRIFDFPLMVNPVGEYAAALMQDGVAFPGWDFAMARLYPKPDETESN